MTAVVTIPPPSARAFPLGAAELLRGVRRNAPPDRAIRPTDARGRTTGAGRRGGSTRRLVALGAFLATLFVVAPPTLAGGTYGRGPSAAGELATAARASVVDLWRSGTGDLPPTLRSAVDYWARYHAAKALLAGLLAVVLIALGLRLWRSLAASGPAGRRGTRAALLVVAALALGAGVLAMANIQGAVAPLFSLLALAQPGHHGGDPALMATQARELLATPAATRGGAHAEALGTLVDGFARYHAVLAVLATGAAIGLAVLGTRALRARRSRVVTAPARPTLRTLGVSAIGVALLLGLVAAANVSNAIAPEPGLVLFLGGA